MLRYRSRPLLVSFLLAAGCATAPAHKDSPAGDPGALTVVAEIALKRGDCKMAAENYAQAAATGGAELARRASQVALACEHLPAAWAAAQRWHALAPGDLEADAMYAVVALKLDRIGDARKALAEFRQRAASAAVQGAPSAGGAARPAANGAGADALIGQMIVALLEQAEAPEILAAAQGVLDVGDPSPAIAALLGTVALEAWNSASAEQYARAALAHDPSSIAAKRVLVRAYLLRGAGDSAIATARELGEHGGQASGFELAEILTALDRWSEARQELEQLRSTPAPAADIERHLAVLALQAGDLKDAREHFLKLSSSSDASGDSVMLSLADIAARQGDVEAALIGYRRLYDSSVAVAARSRAAELLLARKDRTEALTLLDDYIADHPEGDIEVTLIKAHLLADHEDSGTALTLLDAALERHPAHPKLKYERGVMLEEAGRVSEAVAALEKLLKERPDDPTVLNSLGYTLADHDLQLARAERLIRGALASTPDSPAALDSLGWLRFRQRNFKDAAAQLERAYSTGKDPEIAAHLGEALWEAGNPQRAREVWTTALARQPDSRPLKATMARFGPTADSQ